MVTANVRLLDSTGPLAPATLLGHNLEVYGTSTRDLSTERLDNPQFAGPETQNTGIAKGWHAPSYNFQGIRYELVAGEGIMGSNAQLLDAVARRRGSGLVQPSRWVRRRERLEISLWARVNHHPATIRVGLRPAAQYAQDYASAQMPVTSACWQEYRVEVEVPVDDDAAVFFCFLEEPGQVYLDQVHLRPAGAGLFRTDVLQELGEFRIPSLRFPGGCVTTAYHWEYGTGPHYRRPVLPDPVFKEDMLYEFGTDDYLEFCQAHGVVPYLTVNIGTGTPDEAAEWAAYCATWYRQRGLEPPEMYWQLGNEHYGFWERAHMTGEMYAETVRALVPGIRAAYPRARILALGQESSDDLYDGSKTTPWRGPLLDQAADLIDGLALQVYCTVPISADPTEQQRQVLTKAEWFAQVLQEAADDVTARGLHFPVGLSEWGLWLHASHFSPRGFYEPFDIQHGLFAATMFHHFLRLAPRLEFTNFYKIISGMGLFQVERDEVRKTHVAEVFSLYREALPGEVLPVQTDSPTGGGDLRSVEAVAVKSDAGVYLFLANRSLEDTLRVTLEGFGQGGEGRALVGRGPLEMEAETCDLEAANGEVKLPPMTVGRVLMGPG